MALKPSSGPLALGVSYIATLVLRYGLWGQYDIPSPNQQVGGLSGLAQKYVDHFCPLDSGTYEEV